MDFSPLFRGFQKYKEAIIYLFFGALTTVVNYLVYFPCYNLLSLSAAVSSILAWVGQSMLCAVSASLLTVLVSLAFDREGLFGLLRRGKAFLKK